jgi:hypothetical protein
MSDSGAGGPGDESDDNDSGAGDLGRGTWSLSLTGCCGTRLVDVGTNG